MKVPLKTTVTYGIGLFESNSVIFPEISVFWALTPQMENSKNKIIRPIGFLIVVH